MEQTPSPSHHRFTSRPSKSLQEVLLELETRKPKSNGKVDSFDPQVFTATAEVANTNTESRKSELINTQGNAADTKRGAKSLEQPERRQGLRVDVRPSAGNLSERHFRTVSGHGLLIENCDSRHGTLRPGAYLFPPRWPLRSRRPYPVMQEDRDCAHRHIQL